MGWVQEKFKTIDVGDQRLNRRAMMLAEQLGQKLGTSIPKACENWTESAATSRFLRNGQISCKRTAAVHGQVTVTRARETAVMLYM